MRWLLLYSLFIVGCNDSFHTKSKSDPRSVVGVSPYIQPYVTKYINIKGSPLNYDIPIGFVPQSGNIIGMCTRWSNGFRQIEVDPDYWNDPQTTEEERITLIFHELGHCDLNRDHVTTLLSSGWPTSFMYPYNLGYPHFMKPYYFSELFHPVTSTISSTTSAMQDDDCVHDIEVTESDSNNIHNENN